MPDRAQASEDASSFRIDGVTVVDTADGSLSPAMSVDIDDGWITSVAPRQGSVAGPQRRVIDAGGRFVVPGFNDMHVHSLLEPDPSGAFALMLANGITGMRQMMGTHDLLARRRDGRRLVGVDAPELLAMPGPLLTPMNAASPEDARATVERQRLAGADFIKVILLPRPALFAALGAADAAGMMVAGHLQNGVDPREASRSGFRCVEHLGTGDSVWVACSTDEETLVAEERPPGLRIPPKAPVIGRLIERLVEKKLRNLIINPAAFTTSPAVAARLKHALDTFSKEKARRLADDLAADGTWQVPTLIRLRTQQLADEHSSDPNVRYVRPGTVRRWQKVTQGAFQDLPPDTRRTLRDAYEHELQLTKIYDDAGTLMMTGSDETGGWDIAGFSLHQEFDELAAAGLTPLKILQMTTTLPSRFLGRTDTMGSVATARQADLVILDGDPTASAANLHRIHAVVRSGRYLSRADLDALLSRVEAGKGSLAP